MAAARRCTRALLAAALCCVALVPAPAPGTEARATPPHAAAGDESPSRPRIGLVLSGGGARGAAHIGVLKVLHDLHVPIDAIAGTSMGAVVGGLYASGLSPREIEAAMTSLSWQDAFLDRPPRADLGFRRKQEDENFLVRLPLGLRGGRFLLPRGLIQGQKLTQTLRRLTLPVARIQDFDALPTPFRAVATDLETGDRVVLGAGDLPTAMRASLSAPGVFVPVDVDGRMLVDGGLTDNLPVQVAREMGVDVLIVVDVSAPLLQRRQLETVPAISNQMLAIMIRREAQRQRATLEPGDVVIEPPLGDASSFDFSDIARQVEVGERGARAIAASLERLALTPAQYERYVAARAATRDQPGPDIDFVRVRPDSRRYAAMLQDVFGDLAGEPLQPERTARMISNIFGRGNLETLDYRIVRDGDRYGIELAARRNSWGPNYIRFGLNLQDDFEGDSVYNAAARVTLAEITKAGGEWVWDFQVGQSPRIATEVWLPFGPTSPWFAMPYGRFELRTLPLIEDDARIAEYRVRTSSYGLDLGRELRSWGELRVGYRREFGTQRVRVGDPVDFPSSRFAADQYYARFAVDTVDDLNFPRHGQRLSVEWLRDSSRLRAQQQNIELLTADYLAAGSRGRNTAVFWLSAGSTVSGRVTEARSLFPLGGLFRLSGVSPDAVSGPHYGIARMLLYRQIGTAGTGGFLDVPTYAGFSLEMGEAVTERGDLSFGSARRNGSLFLGLDTLLGPVYLAVGHEEGGRTAFYLFLGRTF